MEELKNIFMHVVKDNYANFNGRARRREFWMYYLGYMILVIIAAIIMSILGMLGSVGGILGTILYAGVALGLFIPTLAVGVRRLHDTNKSGWFMLLGLVPLVGLALIYFFVIEGDKGPNQYGEDPKAGEA